MGKNPILDLLDSFQDRPVAYYKAYTRITGSVTAGILLSQIVYWDKAMNHQEFHKTNQDFMEELGMSLDEFKSAKKKLAPFVNIRIGGIPRRTFYQLDREALINSLTSWGQSHQPVGGNPTDGSVEIPPIYTENTTETTTEILDIPNGISNTAEADFSEKDFSPIEEKNLEVTSEEIIKGEKVPAEPTADPPVPVKYGNHECNEIIRAITDAHGTCDGTILMQRRGANHLKNKISKIRGFNGDYYQFIHTICTRTSKYHISKTTSPKLIFDHLGLLIANLREELNPKSRVG